MYKKAITQNLLNPKFYFLYLTDSLCALTSSLSCPTTSGILSLHFFHSSAVKEQML